MHEGMRRIYENGTRIMRYFTLDQHEDTRQLSDRFGGVLTGSSVRMGLEVCAPTEGPSAGQGDAGR